MKSFIAALILLAVILGCSILNCVYIDKVTGKMLDLETTFPVKLTDGRTTSSSVIDEANELWKKAVPRLSTTVKATYINTITIALDNATDYYENGASADYTAMRHILRDALTALKEADALSFRSII